MGVGVPQEWRVLREGTGRGQCIGKEKGLEVRV